MSRRESRWRAADALIAVVLLIVAVREGLRVTSGLHVPPDPDLFRDAAQAQTMADGVWGGDPFFAGEFLWYNPLVPALVALLHAVTRTPILGLYARGGVVLNLFGPLTFFALARRLFGSGAAAAATLAFLFLAPRDLPGWAAAGYSPWLFAGVFTQALFYTGVIVADQAARSQQAGWWLLAGIVLGVTFLGHTAPALLLGGILVLTAVSVARMRRAAVAPLTSRPGFLLAACLALAAMVSLPLAIPVAGRYRLAVENGAPAGWTLPATEPGNFLKLIEAHATVGVALALIGVALLLFSDPERRERARILGRWAFVNGAFLALHYATPLFAAVGFGLPPIVPAFHFLFYVEAILALLAGYALWRFVEWAARLLAPAFHPWASPAASAHVLLGAVLLAVLAMAVPRYRARQDLVESREQALRYEARQADARARNWIRTATRPGSVFLASDLVSLYVVGPAGGKVVSLEAVFANPYVRVTDREADRRVMMDALASGDRDEFCALATRYDVRYVIADANRPVEPLVPHLTFLTDAYSVRGIQVWRVDGCHRTSR